MKGLVSLRSYSYTCELDYDDGWHGKISLNILIKGYNTYLSAGRVYF